MTAAELVADVLARIVTAREAHGVGDAAYVAELLRDLEVDIVLWRDGAETNPGG